MNGPYNLPYYKNTHFEYKALTKVHGRPTVNNVITLLKEVKRNAQKVSTTLGGGQLGYLGLGLST